MHKLAGRPRLMAVQLPYMYITGLQFALFSRNHIIIIATIIIIIIIIIVSCCCCCHGESSIACAEKSSLNGSLDSQQRKQRAKEVPNALRLMLAITNLRSSSLAKGLYLFGMSANLVYMTPGLVCTELSIILVANNNQSAFSSETQTRPIVSSRRFDRFFRLG